MEKKYLYPADILLPKDNYNKWAVIACDQFTSESDYWDEVEKIVGDAPSTLKVTLPEIYLNKGDVNKRIKSINDTMKDYLQSDVFNRYEDAMIYVERLQSDGKTRHGIVGAINLNDYDYHKGSHVLIRATEQTVLERIPPRVEIRKGAVLEIPHVLLLIDDPMRTVVETIATKKNEMEKLYDFELMLGGGHVAGYLLTKEHQQQVQQALAGLVKQDDAFLFAVGDGNHSLATAKECYNLKLSTGITMTSKALVEVMNIHDDALEFEPIYRVVFGVDRNELICKFIEFAGGEYFSKDAQVFDVMTDGERSRVVSVKPLSNLPVGTLQLFLDSWCKEHPETVVDYVHGTDSVTQLSKTENTVGFIYNGMTKSQLFPAVRADGALPRKTFSMGHAKDKRYYIEARKIK